MPLGVVELELAANPLNGKGRFSRAKPESTEGHGWTA